GQSLWRELVLLTGTGLSPAAALRAATSAAADFLAQPRLGRLAADCAADLAIVRGDLSRALPDRPEVELVVRGGTPHRPADLLRQPDDPTWRGDPWARQFEQHWTRRMQT
ncbi:MAG: amidohydrolase family protein, partial [Candidatus Latescibacteria bacterium]|nr:amidohydrolase family protein [Candidatus Latescibacterota bacterium]